MQQINQTYSIEDLMKIFKKSRPTIWRWRNKGILPKPDIEQGSFPVWFKATLENHLPNLNTTPSS
jgi:predicted DNA-binding transcriptional regulator AlpA